MTGSAPTKDENGEVCLIAARSMSTPALNFAERALLVLLCVFAVAISVIGIFRPMFIDEANSIIISSFGLRGVIDHLRNDNNLPFYYLLLHEWVKFFGISEIATRTLSIIFYFLAIFVAGKLGKELSHDKRVALYTAFFYAISLQAIHLAQKVRMYSLLGFLAGLSTLLFFRSFWNTDYRRRDLLAYVLVNIAGSFTHVWFVFLPFAQFVCHLAFFPRSTFRRFFACLCFSGLPFLLLWARFLPEQINNGATNWMPRLHLWAFPGAFLEFYGGRRIGALFSLICLLLLSEKEWGNSQSLTAEQTRKQLGLLTILVLSVAIPMFVSLFKPIYYPGRYTIIALPSLAALLAWRLALAARRSVLAAYAYLLLAAILSLHIVTRHQRIESNQEMLVYSESDKPAAEQLIQRIHPGDSVIFTGLSRASIEYYLRLSHRGEGVALLSYPTENADHLGWDATNYHRASLDAEAARLAGELSASSAGKPVRIWVVSGTKPGDHVLFDQMEKHFALLEVLPVPGAFFTEIVVFQNAPRNSPSVVAPPPV
jgi:hypothetical protein